MIDAFDNLKKETEIIENIADVICCLRDQPGTSNRYPDGYDDVMKRLLN